MSGAWGLTLPPGSQLGLAAPFASIRGSSLIWCKEKDWKPVSNVDSPMASDSDNAASQASVQRFGKALRPPFPRGGVMSMAFQQNGKDHIAVGQPGHRSLAASSCSSIRANSSLLRAGIPRAPACEIGGRSIRRTVPSGSFKALDSISAKRLFKLVPLCAARALAWRKSGSGKSRVVRIH